jgi:hypothetical protein
MKLEEMVDLGNGVVFAVARQTALSAGSSAPLRLRHAAVAVWEDGIAVSITNYPDLDQARSVAEELASARAKRPA